MFDSRLDHRRAISAWRFVKPSSLVVCAKTFVLLAEGERRGL